MRKRLWSPVEDEKLTQYLIKNGYQCWNVVAKEAGLQRCGKSCRLRWINYLRPGLRRSKFSSKEKELVMELHHKYGNRWTKIASHLEGRTDNDVKNLWHSQMKTHQNNNSNNNNNKQQVVKNEKERLPNDFLDTLAMSTSFNKNIKDGQGLNEVLIQAQSARPKIFPFILESNNNAGNHGLDQDHMNHIDKLLPLSDVNEILMHNLGDITNHSMVNYQMSSNDFPFINIDNDLFDLETDLESTIFNQAALMENLTDISNYSHDSIGVITNQYEYEEGETLFDTLIQ